MKKLKHIYLVLLLMLSLQTFAQHTQPPKVAWARQLGASQSAICYNSTTDRDGNILICGKFDDTIYTTIDTLISAEYWDPFLAKYDTLGNLLWAKSFKGPVYDDPGLSITIDNDNNIIIIGYFYGQLAIDDTILISAGANDIYIAKFTSNGKLLWAKREGGTNREAATVAHIDSKDNIYLTGIFEDNTRWGDTLIRSTGGQDLFLAKINKEGIFQWIRQEGRGICGGYGLCIDNSDNIYIAGNSNNTINFDTTITFHGAIDILLMKYNSTGNCLWAKLFGNTGDEHGRSIAIDSANNIYFAGEFFSNICTFDQITITADTTAAFFAKCDSSGNMIWAKAFECTFPAPMPDFQINAKGEIFISYNYENHTTIGDTTFYSNNPQWYSTCLFAQMDSAGTILWAKQILGDQYSLIYHFCIDYQKSKSILYITGDFAYTGIFDSISLQTSYVGNNGNDVFIAKYYIEHETSYSKIISENKSIVCYPNPTNGIFNVKIPDILSSPITIQVYNTNSQLLYKTIYNKSNNNLIQLDLTNYQKGIYFITLTQHSTIYSTKVIVY